MSEHTGKPYISEQIYYYNVSTCIHYRFAGRVFHKQFMSSKELISQILDGKYKIDKQLGKGGMGTVYLSTHIGTARPVAVKVIAPDFMKRAEFVERFRREAKAACVITQSLSQLVLLPSILLLASITSVITALLYFKIRQAGGESMQELLGKLNETELPQSKWLTACPRTSDTIGKNYRYNRKS